MKTDILTLTAIVLVIGMLVTSLDLQEAFSKESIEEPADFQQGVVLVQQS